MPGIDLQIFFILPYGPPEIPLVPAVRPGGVEKFPQESVPLQDPDFLCLLLQGEHFLGIDVDPTLLHNNGIDLFQHIRHRIDLAVVQKFPTVIADQACILNFVKTAAP